MLKSSLKVVCFIVLMLGFSGCATIRENLDLEVQQLQKVQQLQDRINYLERQLQKQQEKNLSLVEELRGARKEIESLSVVQAQIRMPTAKEIQTALKNAGFYDHEITGIIGPVTREAIINFQIANGLNPDGVVGSRTWSILVKYLKGAQKEK